MCTCSMRIACKPGPEVPEHLNLSRTPAPFLSARALVSFVCRRPHAATQSKGRLIAVYCPPDAEAAMSNGKAHRPWPGG